LQREIFRRWAQFKLEEEETRRLGVDEAVGQRMDSASLSGLDYVSDQCIVVHYLPYNISIAMFDIWIFIRKLNGK
jgi:hypothetical protein